MRIGIYFGCFIPLHNGHEAMIKTALSENDHLILGICGYDKDRGRDYIPFRQRIDLMSKIYSRCENITLAIVDDKKIGLKGTFSLNAWEIWCSELFQNSGFDPGDKANQYVWYSGEKDYLEKIQQLYPSHEMRHISRDLIPISGTEIRANTSQYITHVNPFFASYLAERGLLEDNKHEV